MVENDDLFVTYEYVIPSKSQDWNIESIYVIKDTSMIISVKYLLYSNSNNKF